MHLFIVYINEPYVVYVQHNAIVAYLFSFGVETDYVHFDLNPIRSGLFQTVNDPGGGGL